MPNLISLTRPSLQIFGSTQTGGISHFRISGQSLLKINWHNSKTNSDIGMKFGPATQLDRRNKATSTKLGNNVMLANCDVIVIFLIYDQFGGSRIQM